MKKNNLIIKLIFLLTILGSCDLYFSEDFKKLNEINLSKFNKELKSEKIYFELIKATNNGVTEKRINVIIEDIKKKNIDLKNTNKHIFELIERKKIDLKKYDKIKFWYYSDYSNAKLRILYVYNNQKEIIDVSYR